MMIAPPVLCFLFVIYRLMGTPLNARHTLLAMIAEHGQARPVGSAGMTTLDFMEGYIINRTDIRAYFTASANI
jgi:hypothetical protein